MITFLGKKDEKIRNQKNEVIAICIINPKAVKKNSQRFFLPSKTVAKGKVLLVQISLDQS